MNSIKAVIVDDEEDARKVLKKLIELSKLPIEISALCTDLEHGVKAIREHQPNVVFLDVQMPRYAGYEIIDFFDEINFEIVFVTAFDSYALKAFELSAIDYLLKPINRLSLNETLEKVLNSIHTKRAAKEFEVLRDSVMNRNLEKIVIPEIGANLVLTLKDIISIKGDGNYSNINLTDGSRATVSKNLKYFENAMQGCGFFRSQKSWIINMDHLKRFNGNTGDIFLTNGLKAKISPNRLEAFNELLKGS